MVIKNAQVSGLNDRVEWSDIDFHRETKTEGKQMLVVIKFFKELGSTLEIKTNCKVVYFWILHLTSKREQFLQRGSQIAHYAILTYHSTNPSTVLNHITKWIASVLSINYRNREIFNNNNKKKRIGNALKMTDTQENCHMKMKMRKTKIQMM